MYEDNILITMLLADESNFRIGEFDNQRNTIRAIIEEQRKKLETLAKHILEFGLSPIEKLVVVEDEDNVSGAHSKNKKFIVCEGNRRITALKLMANPQLAKGTELESTFNKLAKKFLTNPIEKVNCIIMPDKDTAFKWIELRHSNKLSGAGLEKWGTIAQSNSEAAKGEKRRWHSVIDFLASQGVDTSSVREKIKKKTTALDRVFGAAAMKNHLGVTFSKDDEVSFENNDLIAGKKLLNKMIVKMAEKDFSTNDVHAFYDREEFIKNFTKFSVRRNPAKKTNSSDDQSNSKILNNEKNGKQNKSSQKKPEDRTTLARTNKGDAYTVYDSGLNNLYKELKKLKVETYPFTSSAMIRVFLELSTDAYLKQNAILPPNTQTTGGWQGFNLRERVGAVVTKLDPEKLNKKLDIVRKGLSGDKGWLHAIGNLNEFVHVASSDPSGNEAKKIWDRYNEYFKLIHE